MCEIKYLVDVLTLLSFFSIKGRSRSWIFDFMVINWIYLQWFPFQPFQYCLFPWCSDDDKNNNNNKKKLMVILWIWAAVYTLHCKASLLKKNKIRFELKFGQIKLVSVTPIYEMVLKKKKKLLRSQVHTAYWTSSCSALNSRDKPPFFPINTYRLQEKNFATWFLYSDLFFIQPRGWLIWALEPFVAVAQKREKLSLILSFHCLWFIYQYFYFLRFVLVHDFLN